MFKTELRLLARRSHTWLYPVCFFVLVISLFPLAFTPDPVFLQKYLPGCIWLAALLASLLASESIFTAELEDGYLEQMILSDTPLAYAVAIKLAAQWLVTALPLILLTPLLGILSGISMQVILALMFSLLLGTPILTLIGALANALTIGLRQQGALLGLLILPLVTPILIFGASIPQQAQTNFSISAPLAFVAGLCLLAIMLLPLAIAVALKMSVDD